jgi:hypothetical protein
LKWNELFQVKKEIKCAGETCTWVCEDSN